MADSPVIRLRLATGRTDKGETANYRVFEGGGQMQVKNERGETLNKNVILGGNGTIYIGNEVSKGHDAWVLLPEARFIELTRGKASPPAPAKKGRK